MDKSIFFYILFFYLINYSLSLPTFTFERTIFVYHNKEIITYITISEDNISLLMNKDSNSDYKEIHRNEKNPKLFVLTLYEPGEYHFRYIQNGNEIELIQKIKVYKNFEDFINIKTRNNRNCFYLKENLEYEIEDNDNNDLSNINLWLYQENNEITNSEEVLIQFSKVSNKYILNTNSLELSIGTYNLLITQGNDIEEYLSKSNLIYFTEIIPKSYFYAYSKKLYLTTSCNILYIDLILKNEDKSTNIQCNENSIYNKTNKQFLCEFTNNISVGYYDFFYDSIQLGENILSSDNINNIIYSIDTSVIIYLGYNQIIINSSGFFDNYNIEKIIIIVNGEKKELFIIEDYYEKEDFLSLSLNINKYDEIILSQIMRKLEDYEIDNPPSEEELSFFFPLNTKLFVQSAFDKFKVNPEYVFIYYNQSDKYMKKYSLYSDFELIFDESNEKDINYYKNYFCPNNSNRQFYCDLNNSSGNIIKAKFEKVIENGDIILENTYSERKILSPIIYNIENLCQNIQKSIPVNPIYLTFKVPKNKNIKVFYNSAFLNESSISEKEHVIIQSFNITSPINESEIRVYTSNENFKSFKIEFSKNDFPNFTYNSLNINESYSNFTILFNSSTTEFSSDLKNGKFYFKNLESYSSCSYNETLNGISCNIQTLIHSTYYLYFENKCLESIKLNFKIIGESLINNPVFQLKISGNFFLISNQMEKPFFIDIYNAIDIANIYLNDTLIAEGPFENNKMTIYYNFTNIGNYEIYSEKKNDSEYNKKIRNNPEKYCNNHEINDCLNLQKHSIIYVRNTINDLFPNFYVDPSCSLDYKSFKLYVSKTAESFSVVDNNYPMIKFKSLSISYKDLSDSINTYDLNSYLIYDSKKEYSISVLDYNDAYGRTKILYENFFFNYSNILIENPTFIINNYIKFKGVTCEHGNISIRKMNGQIINNNCFLFENELNCEIIEDFVGKVNIYLGENKLDSTFFKLIF